MAKLILDIYDHTDETLSKPVTVLDSVADVEYVERGGGYLRFTWNGKQLKTNVPYIYEED